MIFFCYQASVVLVLQAASWRHRDKSSEAINNRNLDFVSRFDYIGYIKEMLASLYYGSLVNSRNVQKCLGSNNSKIADGTYKHHTNWSDCGCGGWSRAYIQIMAI